MCGGRYVQTEIKGKVNSATVLTTHLLPVISRDFHNGDGISQQD